MDNIFDPFHNLREIAKHMILLEDHLCNPERECRDCIGKHILTIEAFAEEGATLDKTTRLHGLFYGLAQSTRQAWVLYFEKGAKPKEVMQGIRACRKRLVGILNSRRPAPATLSGGGRSGGR